MANRGAVRTLWAPGIEDTGCSGDLGQAKAPGMRLSLLGIQEQVSLAQEKD